MSNAQYGRTWYEAPTKITRAGETWNFTASAQEIAKYGKQALIRAAHREGVRYRFIWNQRNAEYEMWTRPKPKGER